VIKELSYRLHRQQEMIAGIPIEVECLQDLDQTIDDLFALLQETGDASLLEELCPYFGAIWPAARVLGEAVGRLGRDVAGKRLLELGCGLAIPSLVAVKLGAVVTATDFHPEVPILLRRNLALNGLAELEYVRVDWQSALPDLGTYDYVIGSDVLYEKNHASRVSALIERYLCQGGTALLADPARPYLQSFLDEMKGKGFCAETEVVATKS
jgi:predicted nicotinamide N-methyase